MTKKYRLFKAYSYFQSIQLSKTRAHHDNVTDIESVAIYNEETEEVTIFAVNRNLFYDIELDTDVRSFEGYHIVEHMVLESNDLKSVNGFASERVKPVVTNQSTMDEGMLKSMLHKLSWNMIRLAKK